MQGEKGEKQLVENGCKICQLTSFVTLLRPALHFVQAVVDLLQLLLHHVQLVYSARDETLIVR